MPIARTPWIDDDGTGTTGTILNNAEKQLLYNQIDQQLPLFQAVPFSAGDFWAGAPMVWTVSAAAMVENRYALIGQRVMVWSIYLAWFQGGNVLSGGPASGLHIRIPGGKSIGSNTMLPITFNGGISGVPALAGLKAAAGGDSLRLSKFDDSPFLLSDVPGFVTTFMFEVQ